MCLGEVIPGPRVPASRPPSLSTTSLKFSIKFTFVQGVVKCTCSTAVISCLRGEGGHVRVNAAPDAVPEAPDDDFEERSPNFDFEADTEID